MSYIQLDYSHNYMGYTAGTVLHLLDRCKTCAAIPKEFNSLQFPYRFTIFIKINVKVTGGGSFKAIANGDPTCLEMFHKPQMHLFSGQLTILVQSGSESGVIEVEVSGKGVKKGIIKIDVE